VSESPTQADVEQPKKKSRKGLWIALAVVLVIIIAVSSGSGDDKAADNSGHRSGCAREEGSRYRRRSA
jgi:hypothetical protein